MMLRPLDDPTALIASLKMELYASRPSNYSLTVMKELRLRLQAAANDNNLTPPSIHYVPPPNNAERSVILWMAAFYALLFFVGFAGNTTIFTYVVFLTRSLRQSVLSLGNTFVFIVALCIVDSLVVISLPFMLTDLLVGHWLFGRFFCKGYMALESLNKLLSTLLLTAMAFTRYLSVCHPRHRSVHSVRTTLIIIAVCTTIAGTAIAPWVWSADVRPMFDYNVVKLSDNVYVRVEGYKCMVGISRKGKYAFSLSLFAIGYLVPGSLIAFFYGRLLWRLRAQTRTIIHSRIPMRRVTIYTICITVFYFACSTPHWADQFYIFLLISTQNYGRLRSHVPISLAMHMLPYVNSALNWIFYARLNTQFRKGLWLVAERSRRRRNQSLLNKATTNGNGGAGLLTVNGGARRDSDPAAAGESYYYTCTGDATILEHILGQCPTCGQQVSAVLPYNRSASGASSVKETPI